ncbi:MAG: hypothetical protein JO168_22105 [Solirubrobacterales bacterium]|nr:hypothetical protein [Solirubrobacterales bacterium]
MKVLAYTSPGRGHLYPLLGIVAELIRRGDSCVVCTSTASSRTSGLWGR